MLFLPREKGQGLVEYALAHAHEFTMRSGPPGPRLTVGEPAMAEVQRLLRSRLSRLFPIHRSGIALNAWLSNVTLRPEQLSIMQRLCHIDPRPTRGGRTYAGLVYLFRNPNLGGTAFYRWSAPDIVATVEELLPRDPVAAQEYLETSSEYFRQPPQYMAGSNDLAELLTVVPAKFNRMVFYDGESPHSGHIEHPELLSEDLSQGRLTLNFFASVHTQ